MIYPEALKVEIVETDCDTHAPLRLALPTGKAAMSLARFLGRPLSLDRYRLAPLWVLTDLVCISQSVRALESLRVPAREMMLPRAARP